MKPITEALKAVTLPWLVCAHVTLHGFLPCSFSRCNRSKDECNEGKKIPLTGEAVHMKIIHGDDGN